MSEDFLLSREDREQLVLDLFKQRKTRREIAKIARMSFTEIKIIIDREYGSKENNKKGGNSDFSTFAHALKLFLSGKRQVDVAIKLNLPYEQVRAIYLQFLRLNRMHRLRKVYDELGDDIKPFLLLYDKMQENNSTLEQISNAVNFAGTIPQLEEMHSKLSNDIQALESKKTETSCLSNYVEEPD